jgi:hypothetical protein
MKKPKCWNCGEDCPGKVEEQESQTVVPIHYFAEKKEVCPDCYQILRELENLKLIWINPEPEAEFVNPAVAQMLASKGPALFTGLMLRYKVLYH